MSNGNGAKFFNHLKNYLRASTIGLSIMNEKG